MNRPYRPVMKYVSTTVDVLLTTAILFAYHECGGSSTTLKSPTFMNYLLVVPLTALRFDPRLALYAGALAIASYAGLVGYMLAFEPVAFGSVTDIFTTPRVHPLYEVYNEYFTAMEEIVFRHGGTLKQFVGDEIMVMFGAPFPQPEPEAQAVRTAVAMKARLTELVRGWEARGVLAPLDVKIGIHRGRVVVGNVGSPRRTEYAAVGDAVNVASRVMHLAPVLGRPILITEDVYARAADAVRAVEFPPQAVRGRSAPVRVYGVKAALGEDGKWLTWDTADDG